MDGLRIKANQRGNIIERDVRNVKTNFIDFMDINANIKDDDHDFASLDNRD